MNKVYQILDNQKNMYHEISTYSVRIDSLDRILAKCDCIMGLIDTFHNEGLLNDSELETLSREVGDVIKSIAKKEQNMM